MSFLSDIQNESSGGSFLSSLSGDEGGSTKEKPSSLAQLKNLVAGMVTGLPKLAGMAGGEIVEGVKSGGPIGTIKRMASGEETERIKAYKLANPDKGIFDQIVGLLEEDKKPLSAETGRSLQRTGGRVIHPSRYARAQEEGRIVEAIVEDISNASLVAGPAGRALTTPAVANRALNAGALGRAAKVTHGVGTVAKNPVGTPVRGVKNAAAPVVRKGLERRAAGEGHTAGLATKVLDAVDTKAPRQFIARHLGVEGSKARNDILGPIAKFQKAVDNELEEQAVIIRVKHADQLKPLVAAHKAGTLATDDFARAVDALNDAKAPEGHRVTAEGALLAYTDDAKVAARLDEGEAHLREAAAVADERYGAGWGTTDRNPGDPAQRANAILPYAVERATEQTTATVAKAAEQVTAARRRVAKATLHEAGVAVRKPASDPAVIIARHELKQAETLLAKQEKRLAKAEDLLRRRTEKAIADPESYPARLRPALKGGQAVKVTLAEMADEADALLPGSGETLRALADEVAADIDALGPMADRIVHVLSGTAKEFDGPRLMRPQGASPQLREVSAQNRRTQNITPMNAQDLSKLYDRETRIAVGNRVAQKVADEYGITPQKAGLGSLKGEELVKAMDAAGYEAYNMTAGGARMAVGPDTLFLPKALKREFQGWSERRWKWDETLADTYDPLMGVFRTGVLALSPRWHVGSLVGNSIMATISAGMNPVDLVRYLREAKQSYVGKEWTGRAGSGEAAVVRGGGMTSEVADLLRPMRGDKRPGRVRQGVRTGIEKSYAANSYFDNMFRTAVHLRDLDRLGNPHLAMESALRTMGDFGNMTATQRAIGRRIFPFVAWQKEVTKVAFRLPVDHPYRVAWTLHLGGNLGGGAQQQAELPTWAKGAIPLGGDKLFRLGWLNPFGDAAEPIHSPGGALKSLSPLIKLPLEAGLSFRVDKLKPLTGPSGSSQGMRPLPPKSAGAKLLGVLPQTRALRDLPGDRIVRYGNQEPVLRSGSTIDAEAPLGPWALLAQAAGVPWPTYGESEADKARTSKQQEARQRSRATYTHKRKDAARREPAKR